MDQFIVYNNIEIFDAAAPPAGEKVSFPPPNDMWRANIISSARRRCPAGRTSNAVWTGAGSAKPTNLLRAVFSFERVNLFATDHRIDIDRSYHSFAFIKVGKSH